MAVHILVQTIWFALLLQLLTFLMYEDVLPLMAECGWIYSLSLILLVFLHVQP